MACPRAPRWDWNLPLLHPRTLLPLGALWGRKPSQAHLWRPVFAWLSAAGPQGALPQWSQCGCCPLRPFAFCPPGGWGCVACLGRPGRQRDRSPAAGPGNISPQKHLCPLGLQRGRVCFRHYNRLGGGWGERGKEGTKVTRGRQGWGAGGTPTPKVICYQ